MHSKACSSRSIVPASCSRCFDTNSVADRQPNPHAILCAYTITKSAATRTPLQMFKSNLRFHAHGEHAVAICVEPDASCNAMQYHVSWIKPVQRVQFWTKAYMQSHASNLTSAKPTIRRHSHLPTNLEATSSCIAVMHWSHHVQPTAIQCSAALPAAHTQLRP